MRWKQTIYAEPGFLEVNLWEAFEPWRMPPKTNVGILVVSRHLVLRYHESPLKWIEKHFDVISGSQENRTQDIVVYVRSVHIPPKGPNGKLPTFRLGLSKNGRWGVFDKESGELIYPTNPDVLSPEPGPPS